MVKYFCDWCGRETGDDEVRIVRVLLPPDPPITMEVCPECAKKLYPELSSSQGSGST